MFGLWRKPRFDSDTLSSIWVMACRDESPILTAFSVAYRLRGITPEEVVELVKSRQELFRLGLTRGQSRGWKARYQRAAPSAERAPARPTTRRGKAAAQPQKYALPDWLQVFDDQGPAAEQERVREWLGAKTISSSQQALERFLDDHFVVDEIAFRSQFRIDRELEAEPSDLATVNWGLEHIERLRRGRAETRQSIVALTTGIGGVAIGAMVALTAPMITTLYQGRPADTSRLTIDHQARLDTYGALGKAVASADRAARTGDNGALNGTLSEISGAAATLSLLLDRDTRKSLQEQQARVADACISTNPQDSDFAREACLDALHDLQRLIAGTLADIAGR
jgi:hypothetical protein